MPYTQEPGRGPMMKTGRGLRKDLLGPAAHEPGHNDDKKKPKKLDQSKKVSVQTFDEKGNPYNIEVTKGSASHKLAKELGSVPASFRAVRGLTEKNDPFTAGRDPREKRRLMDSIHKAEMSGRRLRKK
jgi:hypothetical protein